MAEKLFNLSILEQQRALKKVPARYIGEHQQRLRRQDGHHHDHTGKVLDTVLMTRGRTIMVSPIELHGQTYWDDPAGNLPRRWLGVGRQYLPEHPEHADLSDEELGVLGYEFHLGRPDMEPYVEDEPPSSPSTSVQAVDGDVVKGSGSRGRGGRNV